VQDFSISIEPRFHETDALGHINNASIAAWLELVRMKFVQSLAGADIIEAQHWVLASLQIDFVAETFFGSEVIARITGAEPGNTSLTVSCELSQGGELTSRARMVMVYMDREGKKPARLPDALRRGLGAA
jgi:acyl-CoA thioester hydrolase